MYLTIHPDGRTFRHDSRPEYDAAGIAHVELTWAGDSPDRPAEAAPLPLPLAEDDLTLWVDVRTVTHAEGLRNIPASILMAQYGSPVRLLAGTVVVTSSRSQASAMVEDARWSHVEALVEDITRAANGLEPFYDRAPAAWAPAAWLASAVLRGMVRVPAPAGTDPYEFLMRDLTLGVAR